MTIAIYFIAAITAYLVSGLNPAIILSTTIYHKDIRNEGSGNPGFTNFKRVFGLKYGWIVFVLDISKAIVLELLFGWLFSIILGEDYRTIGIALTGFFAMLGHAYPVWYKFDGGKAFLVCVTTLFMVSWKAGLVCLVIFLTLLFTIHLMSLASIICVLLGIPAMIFFDVNTVALIMYALCALFTTYRHKKNIVRLFKKEEPKFYFFKKNKKSAPAAVETTDAPEAKQETETKE